MKTFAALSLVILTLLICPLLFGQTRLEFEVASIKPTNLGGGVRIGCHGIDSKFGANDPRELVPLGRCVVVSGRLSHMMGSAYGVSMDMLKGGPDWFMAGDRFDVEAKAEN